MNKRILHLSTLIITGQLSRDEAIKILKSSPYPSMSQLDEDKEYF